MIDVTFLLLVFFIVTLNFRMLEGRLDTALPKGIGGHEGQADEFEKLYVAIYVAEPGELVPDPEAKGLQVYEGRRLRYEVGARRFDSLAGMRDFIATWPTRDIPVSVDAKEATTYGDVIPVVDALLERGFENVAFVGSFEQDW